MYKASFLFQLTDNKIEIIFLQSLSYCMIEVLINYNYKLKLKLQTILHHIKITISVN